MKRILKKKSKGKGKAKAIIHQANPAGEAPLPKTFTYVSDEESQFNANPKTLKSSKKRSSVQTSSALSSSVHTESSLADDSLSDASDSSTEIEPLPGIEEYTFLEDLKTVFVIDDSSSMASIWKEISVAMRHIIPVCSQHDEYGADVAFPNKRGRYSNVKSAEGVRGIFKKMEPSGRVPIGETLSTILRPYLSLLEEHEDEDLKPLNVIVIIGGLPTDEAPYYEIGHVIERNSLRLQKLDLPSSQLGVHFFQIGDCSETARLLQTIDEWCKDGTFPRDIVEANTFNTYDGNLTREAVYGAIEKRTDRLRKGKSRG